MAKPSRWNAEKRYQIVKEALSQKEPVGQIARRHQVSEGLIYRWRDKFFEGGKAALAFDGLKAPENTNEVFQGDFTDDVTEDGEKYRIGGVTEYLSRFNLVSEVLDTETALDLIAVVEAALREIAELGHELAAQMILVTDNGPAMKSRRFKNFVKKTELLIHSRSRKYHPQTIGREERYHGSLKLEHLNRVLPSNRIELIE